MENVDVPRNSCNEMTRHATDHTDTHNKLSKADSMGPPLSSLISEIFLHTIKRTTE
jgi:hypothetical protein